MTIDRPADRQTHSASGNLRIHIRSKAPWDEPRSETEPLAAFRKYVSEPSAETTLRALELSTEVSLRLAELAGRLLELWQEVVELTAEGDPNEPGRSCGPARPMRRLIDDVMRPIVQREMQLPEDHRRLFATAAEMPVSVLGVPHDSAHAAATGAARLICGVWDLVREVATGSGGADGALFLSLLGQALDQLPSTNFRTILQQIRGEHLRARAALEHQPPPSGECELATSVVRPRWSKSHSKKELVAFFGESNKTLAAYLRLARIGFKARSRQSLIVDLNTLPGDLRDRFLLELDARK